MLKSNNLNLIKELVNGQLVLIPDQLGWKNLKESPEIDGIEILSRKTINILWEQLEFASCYPEFTVGLFKPSEVLNKWLPLLLLKTTGGWQRVHLEKLTCNKCGWEGQTANPLLADLYIGVLNKWDVLKATEKFPALPCPRCKSILPRYPIWVEPII